MTTTHTATTTFTIANARYITSKVAADLRQLNLFYKSPSAERIKQFAEEAAVLLNGGHLERVDYGFKRKSLVGDLRWVLLLRYTVRNGVLEDDHAGRVPPGVDIDGATFASYLTYSSAFLGLSVADQ